jgi:hypothetical protein
MNGEAVGHVSDLLPAYVNGTLDAGATARVEAHLGSCRACQGELAEWQAIAGVAYRAYQRVSSPADTLLDRVWAEIDMTAPHREGWRLVRQLHWLRQLLLGQIPLVRRGIWAASALTMALGCAVELLQAYGAGRALALFAPVIAAMGVAFVYGPESDPSLEIALATPTTARLVLLCRLTLVYAYDIFLAVIASAVIMQARGGAGIWSVIVLWLGPMLFLSTLSLVLTLIFGSAAGIGAALAIWATRVVASSHWIVGARSELFARFWGNNALLIPIAAALLVFAFIAIPWREQYAFGNRYRHASA